MSESPLDRDPAMESNERTPRWVYVLGIVGVMLVVLFAVVHLAGGGFGNHGSDSRPPAHGPGTHGEAQR